MTAEAGQGMSWRIGALPQQHGRVIVVTGANAGLGFWTSYRLAAAGAGVILAGRNAGRLEAAAAAIRARVPDAELTMLPLDLAGLASVRAAGAHLASLPRLDVLVNNAGIVHAPRLRRETADGLELVAGTNFFGPFALTAAALPALERTPGSRVVSLGSLATLLVKLRLEDLQLLHGYTPWRAYAQSKILLSSFGYELDRRLLAAGSAVRSLVAHPGYSISGRTPWVPGVNEPSRLDRFVDTLQGPFAQGKERGAWPVLRAVTDPEALGGALYGPRWLTKGAPVRTAAAAVTRNTATARAIWAAAEAATGSVFR